MSRAQTPEIENAVQAGSSLFSVKPVVVTRELASQTPFFFSRPLFGALLVENNASDARDHCANERTFLSWLRLSMYLAIVSCAIIMSFHIRSRPSELERRMALPLGIVFWILSAACLCNGFANYIQTVTKYARHTAIVQSGWKTQVVFVVVAVAIIGSCVLFLVTDPKG
ncbi:hypothetical protein AJ80_06254 [Polytolypa hystricis UAMH7299]|uniref:DUF202 domain-containing protein n=1 Tax=Polytolypa hystricis (strain UAMH7299) TaxID=1447883 RepID=A0A2B7XYC2_POLH7|nr:hypothetical protein AJ80_06254 [Polytolypa hystricis UAMH7299]